MLTLGDLVSRDNLGSECRSNTEVGVAIFLQLHPRCGAVVWKIPEAGREKMAAVLHLAPIERGKLG
jgi:hypothetical protein